MNLLPSTIMLQHPDSASRYVPVQDEPGEAIQALTSTSKGGLGLEEIMVDYEGKATPYHQTAQIVYGLLQAGVVPGEEVAITPRLPSATHETVFRQLMALMSAMEANAVSRRLANTWAVQEVILPMSDDAQALLKVRHRVADVLNLAGRELGLETHPGIIQLIPLFEEVPELVEIKHILADYIRLSRLCGFQEERLRVMLGRSDPALSYGLIAAVLAVKLAIADCYRLAEEQQLEIAPIAGFGALPFRGHVTLENIDNLLVDYAGVRTVAIQSAMRYDHGSERTKKLAQRLKAQLPVVPPLSFTPEERQEMVDFLCLFSLTYLEVFYRLPSYVNAIASFIPSQRDRLLSTKSPVGYVRDLPRPEKLRGMVRDSELRGRLAKLSRNRVDTLPRAIKYTAAFYTIGFPPEFIGTGRGLKLLSQRYGEAGLRRLEEYYPGLRADLSFAARYANPSVTAHFLPPALMEPLKEDLQEVQEILEIPLGPQDSDDALYHTLLEALRPMLKDLLDESYSLLDSREEERRMVTELIIKLGKIRKSLG